MTVAHREQRPLSCEAVPPFPSADLRPACCRLRPARLAGKEACVRAKLYVHHSSSDMKKTREKRDVSKQLFKTDILRTPDPYPPSITHAHPPEPNFFLSFHLPILVGSPSFQTSFPPQDLPTSKRKAQYTLENSAKLIKQ